MPRGKDSRLKDPELYEELRKDGASKEKAAVPKLKARAKELGLSGYSKKNKNELIQTLRNH